MKLINIVKEIVEANALVTTKGGTKNIEYKTPSELDDLKKDSNVSNIETTSGQKLKEMARPPIIYKLSDNYETKLSELPYEDSVKRMVWINGIIDYIDQEGPSSIATVAREKFDTTQHRIADYSRDMVRLGILEPEIEGTIPQFMRQPETPPEISPNVTMGSEDPSLAKYFDDIPNEEESEDFNDDTEPTLPRDIEHSTKVMSDEDYEAFMLYDDLKQRLNSTKSNIIKLKHSRTRAGDVNDKPSTELVRLRALKTSLEDRIATLIASSEYLQKKEAGELPSDLSKHQFVTKYKKEEVPVPTEEPEDEDDDEILEENQIKMFKYYAGIIK